MTANLESSIRGLHDSLHHLQDVVADNFIAMREKVLDKLKTSFASLQASLYHIREFLGRTDDDKGFDASSQCPTDQDFPTFLVRITLLCFFAVCCI